MFHAARAREAVDRSTFLDGACAGDASLRAEVDRLIAADAAASRFGDAPLGIDALPHLSPGTLFGQYRVDQLIGAGGMGQVYRATDTRLHRTVALKLLIPELSIDPEFRSRFEREARLLASLNHPNIAAIYGLEEEGGVQALALEFVDGPTLADRLRAGALPVADALAIARQIAAALEIAHVQGIVHRDLKPANIKITPAGVVKVLDFGIARAGRGTNAGQPTAADTRTGMILGTPAYMSPEQARGLDVDKRADIWAFGGVLFEMLTGRGAFAADTASDSLAKVIEREPDWRTLPAAVPESIRRLIRRCLQKDPTTRLHDIADARIEIDDALSSPTSRDEIAIPRRSRVSATGVLLGIAAMLLIAFAIWSRPAVQPTPGPTGGQAREFGVTFPNNAMPTDGLAVSPDGRRIAANVWTNEGDIWMYTLDGSSPQPLKGGEGGAYPFWSPDSATIGFFRGGQPSRPAQLVTMSLSGGPASVVTSFPSTGSHQHPGGSWGRNNQILFAGSGKLLLIPTSGGDAPIEVPLNGVKGLPGAPKFLPDGRHFIFCAARQVGGTMDLASLDDGRVTELGESDCPGGFAPPDYVLFLRRGSLLAQKIDLRSFTLVGDPHVIASGVTRGAAGIWPELTPSASDDGLLAFPAPRGGSSLGQLTWFDRHGSIIGSIDPPANGAEYVNPAISPTNKNLVAANLLDPQTGTWRIWLIDTARGAASPLTTDAASSLDPVWSVDGTAIVYTSDSGGEFAFYRQPINGGRADRLPVDVSHAFQPIPSDWFRDGRLFFQQLQQSMWSARVSDRIPVRIGDPELASYGPHLSPDGNWLAYAATPGTQPFEVFVERFPDRSIRKQITNGGGAQHPRWTRTEKGTELVYWSNTGGIESTAVSLTDQDIQIGATQVLVPQVLSLIDARTAYDITPDGQRIVVRERAGPPTAGIRVIVNWMAKLK